MYVCWEGKASERLPLWVINYWETMEKLGEDFRKWGKAREALFQDSDESTTELVRTIPWDGIIPTGGRVRDLAGFATQDWLTGTQLDMLASVINCTTKKDRRILRTMHGQALIQRYRAGQKSRHYDTPAFLNTIGRELQHGAQRMIGICINVKSGAVNKLPTASDPGNHWVGLVVDGQRHLLLFGDSQGGDAPKELVEVMRSWLKEYFQEKFSVRLLEYTNQVNSWCCGDLAINMIAHHFDSNIPLAPSDIVRMKEHRRSMLRQVVEEIRSMVGSPFCSSSTPC